MEMLPWVSMQAGFHAPTRCDCPKTACESRSWRGVSGRGSACSSHAWCPVSHWLWEGEGGSGSELLRCPGGLIDGHHEHNGVLQCTCRAVLHLAPSQTYLTCMGTEFGFGEEHDTTTAVPSGWYRVSANPQASWVGSAAAQPCIQTAESALKRGDRGFPTSLRNPVSARKNSCKSVNAIV